MKIKKCEHVSQQPDAEEKDEKKETKWNVCINETLLMSILFIFIWFECCFFSSLSLSPYNASAVNIVANCNVCHCFHVCACSCGANWKVFEREKCKKHFF